MKKTLQDYTRWSSDRASNGKRRKPPVEISQAKTLKDLVRYLAPKTTKVGPGKSSIVSRVHEFLMTHSDQWFTAQRLAFHFDLSESRISHIIWEIDCEDPNIIRKYNGDRKAQYRYDGGDQHVSQNLS